MERVDTRRVFGGKVRLLKTSIKPVLLGLVRPREVEPWKCLISFQCLGVYCAFHITPQTGTVGSQFIVQRVDCQQRLPCQHQLTPDPHRLQDHLSPSCPCLQETTTLTPKSIT